MTNRQKLLDYYMDNPCLSVEIDYLPHGDRLAEYTTMINEMTEDQLIQELQELDLL